MMTGSATVTPLLGTTPAPNPSSLILPALGTTPPAEAGTPVPLRSPTSRGTQRVVPSEAAVWLEAGALEASSARGKNGKPFALVSAPQVHLAPTTKPSTSSSGSSSQGSGKGAAAAALPVSRVGSVAHHRVSHRVLLPPNWEIEQLAEGVVLELWTDALLDWEPMPSPGPRRSCVSACVPSKLEADVAVAASMEAVGDPMNPWGKKESSWASAIAGFFRSLAGSE